MCPEDLPRREDEGGAGSEGGLRRVPPSKVCRLCGRRPVVMRADGLCGFCWLSEWKRGRVRHRSS